MSRTAVLLLPLLLAACATRGPGVDPAATIPVAIQLDLPATPAAHELELRLSRADGDGRPTELLVQSLQSVGGRGLPDSAELRLPQAHADAATPLVVEAWLRDAGGRVLRASAPTAVVIGHGRGSAGPLRDPDQPATVSLQYRCGEHAVTTSFSGDELLLVLDGAGYRLPQAPSASGARYRREDEPAVEFWEHQGEARLSIGAQTLPTCRRSDG